MKKILLLISVFGFLLPSFLAYARLTEAAWDYRTMFDKADLVVIATFENTKDSSERSALPNVDPPVKVIGVTSRFTPQLVLKGAKDIGVFALHHYRFEDLKDAGSMNGPLLVRLPRPPENGEFFIGHNTFLMFLHKEADGRYAPVSGQIDPYGQSIIDLTPAP